MSDDPNRPDADHELDVDISAFLPGGSRFATDEETVETNPVGLDAEGDDGWDTGAPAPEIPAWARDGLPPLPVVDALDQSVRGAEQVADGSDQPVEDDASQPPPVADVGPTVPAAPEVDTTALTRIEGELADVDAAIAAIDAGDLARSSLLTELLAADQTQSTPPDTHSR